VQLRYNTACSALLVADSRGEDATPLDDAARSALRRRALAWLRAELAAWTALFETGSPQDRTTVLVALRWWPRDSDLATIRDDDALARLPESERKDWQSFWNEYDALMRKGGETKPR
jgi:hypothetical protein